MKKLALSVIALVALAVPALAETNQYTDSTGIVWTIEGPMPANWRPFPDAAQHCPSHHILAEKTTLFKGMKPTRSQISEAKARNVGTWHMKCLPDAAPAAQQQAPANQRSNAQPETINVNLLHRI